MSELLLIICGKKETEMSVYPSLDLFGLREQVIVLEDEGGYLGSFIPWDILEDAFGPNLWELFSKWMRGQTVIAGGPFPWDVERFLQGRPMID